jgi:tetratricopeptide (TPR) repeat protein
LELEHAERPDHPFTLFNLGMTCAAAGRHEEAVGWLLKSIGRSGSDESHLRKAYALAIVSYQRLGREQTAWEMCRIGLERFPRDPELRFREGLLLHRSGRLAEAARVFEGLLEPLPERHLTSVDNGLTSFRARQNLATVLMDLNELRRSEEQWRCITQELPRYSPGWHGLAEVLRRQGKAEPDPAYPKC